ncbi:MAG TPA: hypothetical protein VEU51_18900 [Candidatus Acidoferrales bacterium]|nr:hypothetical protein [Candidatus Acidoferrales bacterium]
METYENLIRVELIDDPAAIAERRDADGLSGEPQRCNRCGRHSISIAAILVVPAGGDTCWLLCSECLRALPHSEIQ